MSQAHPTSPSPISSAKVSPSVHRAVSVLAPLLAMALALGVTLILGLNMHRGMEWSDEGLYLASILHPENLFSTPSDFGAFLNPVFNALGRDVYALRLLTYGVLLGCGLLLTLSLLALWRRHARLSASATLAVGVTLAAAPAAYYVYWTPTPSYNYLAFSGIMASFAALALYSLSQRPRHARNTVLRVAALALLGVGGLVAFIGKGTTGAGLGLLALVWMLCCGGPRTTGQRLKDVLIPAALALTLLVGYLLGVSHGLATVKKILLYAELLDTTYGVAQTLGFYAQYVLPLSYLLVLVGWGTWLAAIWAVHAGRLHVALLLAACTAVYNFILAAVLPTPTVSGLCIFPLFCATVIAAALWRTSWRHFGKALLTALAFLVGGLLYHAGTNTEVELKLSEALMLPIIATFTMSMAMRANKRALVVPVLACVLCSMIWGSLATTLLKTYRHNDYALWQLTEPVEMTPGTRPLLVHAERKAFVDWLRTTAAAHGWQPGTPLLNMSYYTSTSLFLLDARKVAASWQVESRYTPMESYPKIFGQIAQEELRRAWILKPVQEGPRHMPLAALPLIGLNFPEDYELLGTSPAEAVKGVWPAEHYELWKPRDKRAVPAPAVEEKAAPESTSDIETKKGEEQVQ